MALELPTLHPVQLGTLRLGETNFMRPLAEPLVP